MSNEHSTPVPNPGSPKAKEQGCLCPVLDNCHGEFPPIPPGTLSEQGDWYLVLGCPLHAPEPGDWPVSEQQPEQPEGEQR